jgi:hypothetical protein
MERRSARATLATDATANYTLENFPNQIASANQKEREKGVANVAAVANYDKVEFCWNTCFNYHNEEEYGCTHPNPKSLNEKTVRPLKCPGFKSIRQEEG